MIKISFSRGLSYSQNGLVWAGFLKFAVKFDFFCDMIQGVWFELTGARKKPFGLLFELFFKKGQLTWDEKKLTLGIDFFKNILCFT